MNVQIRRAQPEDWAEVKQLRLQALRDEPMAFGSTYEREAAFDDDIWRSRLESAATFVALVDDVAVGLVTAVADEERTHLYGMYVTPAARGSGAADGLVRAVLTYASGLGARGVELRVVESNTPARRLYARHGFVPTGRRTGLAHTPSATELELVRDLSTEGGEDHGNVGPAV